MTSVSVLSGAALSRAQDAEAKAIFDLRRRGAQAERLRDSIAADRELRMLDSRTGRAPAVEQLPQSTVLRAPAPVRYMRAPCRAAPGSWRSN